METIWKYPLSGQNPEVISMPSGAVILTVQVQDGTPCLWALVETENEKEDRTLHVVGTGQPFPDAQAAHYVGTFQVGIFVWHVFEVAL